MAAGVGVHGGRRWVVRGSRCGLQACLLVGWLGRRFGGGGGGAAEGQGGSDGGGQEEEGTDQGDHVHAVGEGAAGGGEDGVGELGREVGCGGGCGRQALADRGGDGGGQAWWEGG